MQTTHYDWKKQAAQTIDDVEVEKAFCDQAVGAVANKAAPLMKAPYRLGFETVYKNDKNNRMVGVFAFRVGDHLIYAPAFFLNGAIKGTDLLYQCTPKTFVPLTTEWCQFLISKADQAAGHGISRNQRHQSPAQADLWKLAYPPAGYKSAALDKQAAWEGFLDELATLEPLRPLLREFITEDGGADSVEKIASWMKTNFRFAECLALNCEEETYCPPELVDRIKAAHAPAPAPRDTLVLYTGGLQTGITDAEAFFKAGFALQDSRMAEDISFVTVDDTRELSGVGTAGTYDLMMADGDTSRAFCAPFVDDCCAPSSPWSGNNEDKSYPDTCVVLENGASKNVTAGSLLGKPIKDSTDLRFCGDEVLKDAMASGECYRIFDSKAGSLSPVLYVESQEKSGDVTIYKVVFGHGSPEVLRHNPDYAGMNIRAGALGAPAKFVKVDASAQPRECCTPGESAVWQVSENREVPVGTQDGLNDWALERGAKKASLLYRNAAYHLHTGHRKTSQPLSKVAALVVLTRDLCMDGDTAQDLLKTAAEQHRLDFLLLPPASKAAAMTRVLDDPQFTTESNSMFGVDEQHPQRYALATEQRVPAPPPNRIGDAYDPGMGQGPMPEYSNREADGIDRELLLSMQPEQLASMAQDEKIPHIFEHGVVNSLVRTYDSVAMIDKYLPDLEKALDRLGRILFLFYWKPGDFQDAYGIDDMTDMESELLSNFQSFGDMVLDLLKKSRAKSRGNVALPT